jgi:hypothetical protein
MSDINTDILNQLIVGRVEPHIYAFSTKTVPDYLKVGDTYRPIEKRLDEWRKYFPNLERKFSEVAKVDDEIFFRDYAIHTFLEALGKTRLQKGVIDKLPYFSNEFFKDTNIEDVEKAVLDVKDSHIKNDGRYQFYRFDESRIPVNFTWERTLEYSPRPNQQKAIDNFNEAIKKGRNNLLMYAVMRFGKSFTSMCCATEMKAKFVIIVSAKADVKAEWKKTVESHKRFEGYKFLDSDDLLHSESIITDKLRECRIALFLTLQDLQGEVIKAKHKEVFENSIDLLLIDETHFGARGNEYGRVLSDIGISKTEQRKELSQSDDDLSDLDETIKTLNAKVRIHLSGTPYRILMGSEFTKEDIIAFCQFADIVDEQESWNEENINKDEVKEWDNPYYGFPQMIRFAFNPNESSIKRLEELKKSGITYALSALFKPQSIVKDSKSNKHKKFIHEQEILDLLEVIDGSKKDNNLLGFLDYDKIKRGKMCRHIVCVLPYRASCDALQSLIINNRHKFKNLNSYEIINIAGVEDERTFKKIDAVKKHINKYESEDRKTITLTVNRMLTGSTVEQWDTMLYLKDTASAQEYDQAIFRLQNQFIKSYKDADGDEIKYNMKPQTLLVDFDPYRLFRMQEQKSQIYNANVEDNGNDKLEERIKRELEISPIVTMNHNKMQQVTPTDILKAVSEYSSSKSVADEATVIPVDLSLLNDNDIKAEIEKQSEINSKEGLKIKAVEGDGDALGTPDGEAQDGDSDDGAIKVDPIPTLIKDSKVESIRKKFATYYSRLLFFAFLTNSKVSSVQDILIAIDTNEDNARIAKNLEVSKRILELFRLKMNPFILSKLDYKIQNLNTLANDASLAPLNRAITALRKFGRLSESEIVTPSNVADDMVSILPEKDITGDTKIFDIASKQGEFATALYKRFGEKVKPNIYSATTSNVAYEFTRKIYDILRMPVNNIFDKFNTYDIIETQNESIIKKLKDMKFDVIVGNPPYQENNGGGVGTSGQSIYDDFVGCAKVLAPQYINMIIPSRWLTVVGGKLSTFRTLMIDDNKIKFLYDYIDSSDCFNNVEIKGGVCYFLWDSKYDGKCEVHTRQNNKDIIDNRFLKNPGLDFVVRDGRYLSVIQKVVAHKEPVFSSIVSANDPFGFDVRESGSMKRIKVDYKLEPFKDSVKFYYNGWRKKGIGYVKPSLIRRNNELVNKHKVLIPKAWGTGDSLKDWLNPFIADDNSCCYETYLVVGPFKTKAESLNVISYIQTRFFHLMVSMRKSTQNVMQGAYELVPIQDFSKSWTDAELYKKYNFTKDEINFIESMIKPME